MVNPIDDAFAAADARAAHKRSEEDEQERVNRIYDAQVNSLMEAIVEAIRTKAEELNNHPRVTNKAAIMPAGAEITIRRASRIRMPDRRIDVRFRRDLRKTNFVYEASPNPVFSTYSHIDSGEYAFHVVGDELRIEGFASADGFAEHVIRRYRSDCINDEANPRE